MEEANEQNRRIGATGGVLRELLQQEDVGHVRTAGCKFEEFSQLVDEQKHAGISAVDGGRINLGQDTHNRGTVEESFALGLLQEMRDIFRGGLELALAGVRDGTGDALENTDGHRSPTGGD